MKPLKSMLFPLKTFAYPTSKGRRYESLGNDEYQGHLKKGLVSSDNRKRAEAVTWKGMTPLDMLEKIAAMAESNVATSKRRFPENLRIDTSFLASKTPDLPPLPPGVVRHCFVTDSNRGYPEIKDNCFIKENTVSFDSDDQVSSNLSGNKRARGSFDLDSNSYEADGIMTDVQVDDFLQINLPHWDPSFLISCDPDPHASRVAVEKISSLAVQLETMSTYEACLPSYKRVREEVLQQCTSICNQTNATDDHKRRSLKTMYYETIQKMQALVSMAKKVKNDEVAFHTHISSNPFQAVIPKMESFEIMDEDSSNPTMSNMPLPIKRGFSKKGFTQYMNNWLRQNWTNPYPDDDGLFSIANDCGTTPTVVSNWLINARTRKWRPAIVKAYNNGRPADMLKEDAINIFDGKPLREVPSMHIITTSQINKRKEKN